MVSFARISLRVCGKSIFFIVYVFENTHVDLPNVFLSHLEFRPQVFLFSLTVLLLLNLFSFQCWFFTFTWWTTSRHDDKRGRREIDDRLKVVNKIKKYEDVERLVVVVVDNIRVFSDRKCYNGQANTNDRVRK